MITSTGIGSGLNISAHRLLPDDAYGAAQTTQLTNQQNTLDAQVSAYGTFTARSIPCKLSLPALEDPSQLAAFAATVADKNIASATTSIRCGAGPYSLQVNNLATVATATSAAFSNGTQVGTGTLTIRGGRRVDRDLHRHDQQYRSPASPSAINSAPNNPGVSASVITTTGGSRSGADRNGIPARRIRSRSRPRAATVAWHRWL